MPDPQGDLRGEDADERPGDTGPAAPSPAARSLTAGLLALLGLALLWVVITHSLAAYLADSDPEASLRLRVTARAELNLVEKRLAQMRRPGASFGGNTANAAGAGDKPANPDERDRISVLAELASRRFSNPDPQPDAPVSGPRTPAMEDLYQMVRAALRREPLNSRGLRLLGELSEGHAPREEVARLMRLAVRLNLHEPIAVLWLLNDALTRRDHVETIKFADILLRTEIQLVPHAIQALAKACEDADGLQRVVETVRSNPPWRRTFIAQISRYVADARIPLQILVALKDTPIPPTKQELSPFLDVLMQNKLHELAYYTWIQFLPQDQLARVVVPFNGDFETEPSGLPFDWVIPRSTNAIAGLVPVPPPGRGRALRVEFGLGRIEFAGVSQMILLAPGDYTFIATYTASVNGRRGLVWAVACAEGNEIGRSPMMLGNVAKPTAITFDFKVPDSGCRAQRLRLFHDSRSASEQFVSGWANQQDVSIVRKDEAQ